MPSGFEVWVGERLGFLELLQSVPQLDLRLRQTFGDENGFAGLWIRQRTSNDDEFDLEVLPTAGVRSVGDVLERAPYLDSARHKVVALGDSGQECRIRVSEADFYNLPAREEFAEHIYVLPAALLGVRTEVFLAQYALLHALSIVARYKLHRWGSILRGENTSILPIVEQLIAVAGR